jgi:DmsE family decaheme c-type cytochrome
MRQSVGTVGALSWALRQRYQSGRGHRVEHLRQLIAPAVAGVFFLMASLATPANAATAGDDSSLSALRAYVQSTGDSAGPSNSNVSPGTQYDDVDQALRAFTQKINDDPLVSVRGETKLAAKSLMEWLGGKTNSAPAEMPTAPARAPKKQGPQAAASYVGSKTCLGCHSSLADVFSHTLMGRLLKQGRLQCETCHGPGSEHARLGGGRGVGGILSFEADDPRSAEEKNAVCLGCHERGDRTYWNGSTHQMRGLACTNCHTIMKAVSRKFQLKTAWQPDTCFQCHKDRKAQLFRSSHMPIREGKVVCSDCHNPHGSTTEALLKKDSINDVCYACHAEKRGPFLFEHAPVRQNCLNCHDPHGSVNEFSLKLMRPALCRECHAFGHAQTSGLNSAYLMSRSCQNCHTQIHGSNSPAGAFLQR